MSDPEQVVCIQDISCWWAFELKVGYWEPNGSPVPRLGSIYTVLGRESCECGDCPSPCTGLVLAELGIGDAWDARAFRPVRRTSIEDLRPALVPVKEDA